MYKLISKIKQDDKFGQLIRFGLNGLFVTAIQYGVYLFMQRHTDVNIAYTVGYLISFAVNFFMTSLFTFRTSPTLKRFIGFCGSHAVNYLVQIGLLNIFLFIGMSKIFAPMPAMAGAVIVQFTILRRVYGREK